jgi:hypothetical protein
MSGTLPCFVCHRRLPEDMFYPEPTRSTGRRSACRECTSERNAAYWSANHDKVKAQKAAYRADNREVLRDKSRALYRKRWPDGCAMCGDEKPTAHHRYCGSGCKARARSLKVKFGLSVDEFFDMIARQDCACAICDVRLEPKNIAVDHCHATGRNRALLCRKCNSAIGFLGDDPKLVRRALAYLDHHVALIEESA